jgi:hypothetical protein
MASTGCIAISPLPADRRWIIGTARSQRRRSGCPAGPDRQLSGQFGALTAIATAAGHYLPPCQAARRCHLCEAVYAGVREEVSMADAAPERDGSEDEMKRRFREERKRAQQADATAARGGEDAGKVHGAHGPARNRRSFRRKTGG